MPNLEDFLVYGFNICEAVVRLCNDLPFALRSLTVLPSGEQMTSDFRRFVRAQSSITHLALDAHYTHCFDIGYFSGSDLLPNLTSLISCCRVFSVLAPGRPITQAVIQRCSKHPNRDMDIANFQSALNQTSAPLTALYIDAWGQRDCGKNGWDLLKNVKSTKACSTLLHLTLEEWPSTFVQALQSDPYHLVSIADSVRGFSALRHFSLAERCIGLTQGGATRVDQSSKVTDMALKRAEPQSEFVQSWKETNPNLVGVTLFGRSVSCF